MFGTVPAPVTAAYPVIVPARQAEVLLEFNEFIFLACKSIADYPRINGLWD
jgi:hypothetical protein